MSRICPSCAKKYPDAVFFCGEDGTITVQEQSPDDFDPRLGKQLGGYIVAARVADGAMGRVFEGRHPDTKERVAIKVLHAHVARDAVSRERFNREYEAAVELAHPHVVKVLEFGATDDGSSFLTMEFLEGQELARLLESGKPLIAARTIRIMCQIALALEHAHSFGFIHRDLKPQNVFLRAEESGDAVRVLDFGSVKLQVETGAKLTAIGTTVGSPYYMSPEQAMGKADVDGRTDVFALGAILYEMLTGKVAFDAPNLAMILMKIMHEQPPPPTKINPSCPAGLDAVVAKALKKDKDDRYAGAKDLAAGVLAAYGLTGTVDHWAAQSQAEVEKALNAVPEAPSAAAKPEPSAVAKRSEEPARSKHDSRDDATAPKIILPAVSDAPPVLATGMSPQLITWVAVGIVVCLIGLVALLLR